MAKVSLKDLEGAELLSLSTTLEDLLFEIQLKEGRWVTLTGKEMGSLLERRKKNENKERRVAERSFENY